MAKRRLINTKFWSDGFVVKLKPLEKYLFLYLLTNEHTEICGIYELPLEVMSRETDLKPETLSDLLTKFNGKIRYVDGWVSIKNFTKNQCANESMVRGAERSLSEIPSEILSKFKENNTPSDTLSDPPTPSEILKPKLKPKPKPSDAIIIAENIKPLMDIFYRINPTLNYGNKTQRSACSELIKLLGLDKAVKTAEYAISVQDQQYSPTITTPYQLKEKLSQLIAYYNKHKSKNIIL